MGAALLGMGGRRWGAALLGMGGRRWGAALLGRRGEEMGGSPMEVEGPSLPSASCPCCPPHADKPTAFPPPQPAGRGADAAR